MRGGGRSRVKGNGNRLYKGVKTTAANTVEYSRETRGFVEMKIVVLMVRMNNM